MREEDSQGKQDGTAVRDWHLDLGAPRNHAPGNYLAWGLRELRIHTPIIVLFGGGALISVQEQSGFLQLKKKVLGKEMEVSWCVLKQYTKYDGAWA